MKSFFVSEINATSSDKPLADAKVTVAKMDKDGNLTEVTTQTATTDAEGKYQLAEIPEGTNLIVVATKDVKDETGNEKTIIEKNFVTIEEKDKNTTKENIDLNVESTLTVSTIKDVIITKNQNKSENEKIDTSQITPDEVKEIKEVYANVNADINEKSNPVDIIAKDKDETEKQHEQDLKQIIEDLKQQIAYLKTELETKINDIISSATVTGFVKDALGNILTPTITVTGGSLTQEKQATVYDNGQYLIRMPVSSYPYTITITVENYKTQTLTLYLTEYMTYTKEIILTQESQPVISQISAEQTTVTPNTKINLTGYAKDEDGDALTFNWSATAGTISDEGIVCIALYGVNCTTWTAPATAGTCTITLKVSDEKNEISKTLDITVIAPATQNQLPTATISVSATSGDAPLTITFTATASDTDGTISSYYWDFGDGQTSNEQNPTHTYTTAGNYKPTLTVTDNNGGKQTATANITVNAVNQSPVVSVSALPTTGTDPLTVNFISSATDSDGTIASYTWDFGDGQTSSEQNPTHTYATTGTYTATLTVKDDKSASATTTIIITATNSNQSPTVTISATPTTGNIPLTVQFSATATDDGAIARYDGILTAMELLIIRQPQVVIQVILITLQELIMLHLK